jgi:hypothetical protein
LWLGAQAREALSARNRIGIYIGWLHMSIVNVDLAVMADFEFKPGHPPGQLTKEFPDEADARLRALGEDYKLSEEWLWYRPRKWNQDETPLFRERRIVYRNDLSLPDRPAANGLRFVYLPKRGVGVATVSVSEAAWRINPWEARKSWWTEFDYWLEVFRKSGLLNKKGKAASERIYLFLAVRVDTPDLTIYCHDHASDVAPWFTTGRESESLERKRSLVGPENNISHRSYERLFIRWTDALAIYNLDTVAEAARNDFQPAKTLPPGQDNYSLARCRAAQLFEHCILTRRIFRTDGKQIETLSRTTRMATSFPVVSKNWNRANDVLSAFSQAELEMVVAPPVRSVEASELVDAALKQCGVPQFVEGIRRSYDLLDRRLQWARGQWLAALAVLVFLANLIITFIVK